MSTEIGQLQLQLPPGFEKRAQRIGRLVGENLAGYTSLPTGRIEHLRVGPVAVETHHTDQRVAQRIADSIHAAIKADLT
ncbi:MAG: hypothetical protein PHI97_04945 [Desulfobulbus sp.]|nr:hypothetical protein [Desulfobulbus sp.]